MGDHYLWSFFDSQEAAWSVDPMNAAVRAEVAKLDVKREVRMWDNWRIVRAAEVSEKGHYYNLHVKTDNPSGYIAALDKIHAEMKKRDLDVTMQVYMGDTGETVEQHQYVIAAITKILCNEVRELGCLDAF